MLRSLAAVIKGTHLVPRKGAFEEWEVLLRRFKKFSLVFIVCVLKALSIEDRKLVFLPKIFLENILKVPDLPLCVPKLPVGIIEGFSGGFGSRN